MLEKENKKWFKEHFDTIILFFTILTSILTATIWITSSLNSLDKRLTVIETVMILKNMMPKELAQCENKGE